MAAYRGHLDVVKYLHSVGADIEAKENVSEFHSSLTLNYIALHLRVGLTHLRSCDHTEHKIAI